MRIPERRKVLPTSHLGSGPRVLAPHQGRNQKDNPRCQKKLMEARAKGLRTPTRGKAGRPNPVAKPMEPG